MANMRLRLMTEVAVNVRFAGTALMTAALIPLAACSSDGSDGTASTTVTQAAVTTSMATPTTILAEVDSVGLAQLPDGVHYGLITEVDADAQTVSFDKADLVENGVAATGPLEGISDPKGAAPDLSRMTNEDDTKFDVPYAPDMEVYAVNWGQSLENFEASTQSFLDEFINGDPVQDPTMTHPYLGERSSYWILITDGKITRIVEQA